MAGLDATPEPEVLADNHDRQEVIDLIATWAANDDPDEATVELLHRVLGLD